MPAIPEEARVAASLSALAKLRRTTVSKDPADQPPDPRTPTPGDSAPDDRYSGRRTIGLIVAGVAAVLVVVVIAAVALTSGDGFGPDADDGGSPAELMAVADVSVPATAQDGLDSSGNPVTYNASNLFDQKRRTAWRMPGDGSGQELEIVLDEQHTVTRVGLINGYAKRDAERGDDWYQINRRVMEVTWIFSDGTEVTQPLEEVRRMQSLKLDEPVTTDSIRLRLDTVSDPGGRDFTALSEISIHAGSQR